MAIVMPVEGKDGVFRVWDETRKKFKQLLGGFSEEDLSRVGDDGSHLGQHLKCMLGQMTIAERFIMGLCRGEAPTPLIHPPDAAMAFEYPPGYDEQTSRELWRCLQRTESAYRYNVNTLAPEFLFIRCWDFIVSTTFGHYRRHIRELELTLNGETGVPLEEEWTNPFVNGVENYARGWCELSRSASGAGGWVFADEETPGSGFAGTPTQPARIP